MEYELLSQEEHKKYKAGIEKLVYLSHWSRPDILNAVCKLARHMSALTITHQKAMIRYVEYCLATKYSRLELRPKIEWNGKKRMKFVICGYADASFA